MPDRHYTDTDLAGLYDIESPWSEDRDFYLGLATPERSPVLELGCGTGLIAAAIAEKGIAVTGVDPAEAMLEVARARPLARGAAATDWVRAEAQGFRSEMRFGLIYMTGHAFQVLLGDEDIRACFATMRDHLAPGGLAVFESRNPVLDWRRRWGGTRVLDTGTGPVTVSRRVGDWQGEYLGFSTTYRFADRELTSDSTLRFAPRARIVKLLEEAGLRIDFFHGDWARGKFDAETSEEMIFGVARA